MDIPLRQLGVARRVFESLRVYRLRFHAGSWAIMAVVPDETTGRYNNKNSPVGSLLARSLFLSTLWVSSYSTPSIHFPICFDFFLHFGIRFGTDSASRLCNFFVLKPSFFVNPSHRSPLFRRQAWLRGFSRLLTDTSQCIRFYFFCFPLYSCCFGAVD